MGHTYAVRCTLFVASRINKLETKLEYIFQIKLFFVAVLDLGQKGNARFQYKYFRADEVGGRRGQMGSCYGYIYLQYPGRHQLTRFIPCLKISKYISFRSAANRPNPIQYFVVASKLEAFGFTIYTVSFTPPQTSFHDPCISSYTRYTISLSSRCVYPHIQHPAESRMRIILWNGCGAHPT